MELSALSGFQKGGKSGEVDFLLEQGKSLIMMKSTQLKMQTALDGLLGRLFVPTEEKAKEKKRTLTLRAQEPKTVRKLHVLNPPVFAQVEAAINDKVGTSRVIKVRKKKKKKIFFKKKTNKQKQKQHKKGGWCRFSRQKVDQQAMGDSFWNAFGAARSK